MTTLDPRRRMALIMATCAPAALARAAAQDSTPRGARQRAVALTFLKSLPGQREALKKFVVLNWFAVDEIAVQRGLMAAYSIMDTGSDDGAWNLVVKDTWTDIKGYPAVAEEFLKIGKTRETVLVDSKNFRELGAVVDSKNLIEDVFENSR